ncbi:MAG: glycoside hydrolase family 3 C-terminal domain-containing protein [Bryobacteraceae bacterium]
MTYLAATLVAFALTSMSAMAQYITGAAATCGNQVWATGNVLPATTPAWMNPSDPTWTPSNPYTPANRAIALLNAMTMGQIQYEMASSGGTFETAKTLNGNVEAVNDVIGCGNGSRHLPGLPILCIQTYRITNGPPGIGQDDCATQTKATALPGDLTMVGSWDPAMALAYGQVIGSEMLSTDNQVTEGPGMDMLRIPQGGRAFEYAGEDPFLAGTMVTQIVQGNQGYGTIAMCKHFQGNEEEVDRTSASDVLGEQARNEIYFTPFRMCVEDGPALSVMCAYNLVNGIHQCQDPTSLTDALRTQWGFGTIGYTSTLNSGASSTRLSPGYVQSDFGAINSTSPSILAGANMEENSITHFTPAFLSDALSYRPADGCPSGSPNPGIAPSPVCPSGTPMGVVSANAYQTATNNTGPFGPPPCGLNAYENPNCFTPLQLYTLMQQRFTANFQAGIFDRSEGGLAGTYNTTTPNPAPASYPGLPMPPYPTGTSTTTGPQIDLADAIAHSATARSIADQGAILFKNANNTLPLQCSGAQNIALIGPSSLVSSAYTGGGGSSQIAPIFSVAPLAALQQACPAATITVYPITNTTTTVAAAEAGAASANIAIVIIGDEETEGSDRATVGMVALNGGPLPDLIVQDIVGVQPNTVVVLVNGDTVTLGNPNTNPWPNQVRAILEVGYPGQEYGDVIADLLFGSCTTWNVPSSNLVHQCVPNAINTYAVNPSGKSWGTFPVLATDVPASTTEEYGIAAPPGVTQTNPIPLPSLYTASAISSAPASAPSASTPAGDSYYYNQTYDGLYYYYNEGLEIGYRWYDAQNITPEVCFGFGLSYSTFTITNVSVTPSTNGVTPITVTGTVTNTSGPYGAEVVQVYLGFPANLGEPPRRLVGFEKVWLNPGQSLPFTITINPAATNYPLSYWNATTHNWAIQPGNYTVYVGNSSGSVGSAPNFACTPFAYTGSLTVGSPTSETATNVNASVSVTSSGLIYQRLAKTGAETVTICNNSAVSAVAGPIYLVLSITGSGVTAANNTGTSTALGGAPYWTAQPGPLAPGACVPVTVTLSYGIDNFSTTAAVYSGYPMSIN